VRRENPHNWCQNARLTVLTCSMSVGNRTRAAPFSFALWAQSIRMFVLVARRKCCVLIGEPVFDHPSLPADASANRAGSGSVEDVLTGQDGRNSLAVLCPTANGSLPLGGILRLNVELSVFCADECLGE